MSDALPVAVLGAGIAGLTAAAELRRHGVDTIVFEAGKQVAGLAASHRDPDGFSYDTGAHFITNRLATAVGVLDRCRVVRHYGETVWMRGRATAYPLGLLRTPRYVRDAARRRVAGFRDHEPPHDASEWFRREYGDALADEVALPLVEAWSGVPATELSPAVGDKIPGGILNTVMLKLMARITGRAVAIGYVREKPENVNVWHVYPEEGVGTLCEQLAADLGDAVRLESPVQRIFVEDGRVAAVRVRDRELPVSAVISTAPVNVLARLVDGTRALDRFLPFRFRPMIFVNMRLEGRGLLHDVVTWTPEARFCFFRLTETPLSMPWLAPEGKTLLTVDIGAEIGDAHWDMSDDVLARHCLDQLDPIVPGIERRFLGARVLRVPLAYPVFLNEYEPARRELEESTGVEGLLSVGRNGEFAHILMEDVYWRTVRRVRELVAALEARDHRPDLPTRLGEPTSGDVPIAR